MQQLQATFHNAEVRIVDDSPVTVVLKDVANSIGYRAADLSRSIKDKYKGTHKVHTPGGTQEMICVTRPGLSQVLATLRPQDPEKRRKVEAFQDWIYEDVLEAIYETGSYQGDSAPASHQEDPILSLADATRQIRERQIQIEDRLDRLEEQTEQQERRRLDAQRQLKQLPPAEVDAPDKSDRAKLNEIVRAYVAATDSTYPSAWRDLYREIRYRLRIDVRKRAKNRGISKIEALDRDGLLPDAYAVARKVFGHALGDRL